MKKYALLAILWTPLLVARIGCLHNSMDLEIRKYDYKKYHPVQCSCLCEEHHVICPNGTCSECGHRRDYVFIQHIKTDPTKLINIAQLKKYAGKR